jgi:hypothetical protein
LHGICFWKLREFTHSRRLFVHDGVQLNDHGPSKLLREIWGLLLQHVNWLLFVVSVA